MNEELRTPKIEANRRNARRSTGPKYTASTRFNATKHGLLAEGITELDDPDMFSGFCAKLETELKPVGEIETFLVRQIALGMIRLKRAAWIEAEFTTGELNPPITKTERGVLRMEVSGYADTVVVLDPGLPARLPALAVETLVSKYGRYETQIENRFFRHLHELERLQRMRQGENVPAPASVDVAVHADKPLVASFGNPPQG